MKCWLDRIIFPSVQRSFVSFKTNYQSSVTWNKSWLHHSIVLSLGPITINSTLEVHCKTKLAKMSECALWMKWIGITFSGHPYIGTPNFPFYDLKICTHENVAVKFPVRQFWEGNNQRVALVWRNKFQQHRKAHCEWCNLLQNSATAFASVFMRKTSLIYCLLFWSCAAVKMWGNR